MSMMYDKTPDDFDWSFTAKPNNKWIPDLSDLKLPPETLEQEVFRLRKRVKELEQRLYMQGWELDNARGYVQQGQL